MKGYSIQLEISGPIVLWSRPDTMPNPVSYVAPTLTGSADFVLFEVCGLSTGIDTQAAAPSQRGLGKFTKTGNSALPIVRLVRAQPFKGIFESILLWKSVNVRPLKCEICAPVQFHRYAFNYGGPLRKSDQIKNHTSLQMFAELRRRKPAVLPRTPAL
jgi:hypothetical protein